MAPCARYEGFRPDPQPQGNLVVERNIHLPSVGMDVDIAYYYDGRSTANGPYGYGRTISTNLTAQYTPSSSFVTLTKGNGMLVIYQENNGTGVFASQTPDVLVLSSDSPTHTR